MDPKAILSLVQYMTGGLVLALVIWAIIAKKLVPGWTYQQMEDERNNYLTRYLNKVDPDGAKLTSTPSK